MAVAIDDLRFADLEVLFGLIALLNQEVYRFP
jgi:hypothetical protein